MDGSVDFHEAIAAFNDMLMGLVHPEALDALEVDAASSGSGTRGFTEEDLMALREQQPFEDTVYRLAYFGAAFAAMAVGFLSHKPLIAFTAWVWGLTADSSITSSQFESSFFSLLSIVYSVFAGQTFLFLYERQVNIIQELYGEVFALELLIQQTFLCCDDAAMRHEMATLTRQYIEEELYNPAEMGSPFLVSSSYMKMLRLVANMQIRGKPVNGLVAAAKQVAAAQSRRCAVAAKLLPLAHWFFLFGLGFIFLATFLLFDASELVAGGTTQAHGDVFANAPTDRSALFGALCMLLTLSQQVLVDLEDPFTGMYSFRTALDERISYLAHLLATLEQQGAEYVPGTVLTLSQLGMLHHSGDAGHEGSQHDNSSRPLRAPVMPPRRIGRRVNANRDHEQPRDGKQD